MIPTTISPLQRARSAHRLTLSPSAVLQVDRFRHVFAFGLAVLLGLLARNARGAGVDDSRATPTKPNFVFIIADDLRADALGCTGHPSMKTPHIDRLAREGARFTNFFVTSPLCSPSRASFLTGLYPHSHRVINNDKQGLDVLSHRLMTFPRILREEARYETAFIGKWHMGFDDSRRPGFDHWISFKGQGEFIDPVVNVNGHRQQTTGYATDLLNDWVTDYLRQHRRQPFCLVVSHKAVHAPYLPANRHDDLYADVVYSPPPSADDDLSGKPAMRRKVKTQQPIWRYLRDSSPERGEPRRGRPRDRDAVIRDRMRCLASIDDGVGSILSVLSTRGLLDSTLVMFTSDNGYLLGEHGEFNQKRWAYDECLRVPFVLRWPAGIPAGIERTELLLSVDVAPTLFELAGVNWPEPIHGRSFVPLLGRGRQPWRQSILAEHFLEEIVPRVPDWQAVRTEGWKLIRYPTLEGMDELYDLGTDPFELKNLVREESAMSKLAELRSELTRLLEATAAP